MRNAVCQNGKSVFPDGLSLLSLMNLTLSFHIYDRELLFLFFKFSIFFPLYHLASRDCFGKMKIVHDDKMYVFLVVSLMLQCLPPDFCHISSSH